MFRVGIVIRTGDDYQLLSNGLALGMVFGHMGVSPNASHFFHFVTAHGPFELTAIVFSGAAGLRLGWGLIDTKGQARLWSRRKAHAAFRPSPPRRCCSSWRHSLKGMSRHRRCRMRGRSASRVSVRRCWRLISGSEADRPALGRRSNRAVEPLDSSRLVSFRLASPGSVLGRRPHLDPDSRTFVSRRARPRASWCCEVGRRRRQSLSPRWRASRLRGVECLADARSRILRSRLYLASFALEAPWATAPLTIVLGGLMFSARPTAAQVVRTLLRSLPALIFYQLIVRATLIVSVVLFPVVRRSSRFS